MNNWQIEFDEKFGKFIESHPFQIDLALAFKAFISSLLSKEREAERNEACDCIEKQTEGWVLEDYPFKVLKLSITAARRGDTL
jgi:hypothetical protein